jgi:hypothetical protein
MRRGTEGKRQRERKKNEKEKQRGKRWRELGKYKGERRLGELAEKEVNRMRDKL